MCRGRLKKQDEIQLQRLFYFCRCIIVVIDQSVSNQWIVIVEVGVALAIRHWLKLMLIIYFKKKESNCHTDDPTGEQALGMIRLLANHCQRKQYSSLFPAVTSSRETINLFRGGGGGLVKAWFEQRRGKTAETEIQSCPRLLIGPKGGLDHQTMSKIILHDLVNSNGCYGR